MPPRWCIYRVYSPVCLPWSLGKRESCRKRPPGTLGRIPTYPPWYTHHPGICTPFYHPGYTSHTPSPATVQSSRHRCDRLAALRREVTELNIGDERVSVLPRVPLFRHPFHCWTVLAHPSAPKVIQEGRRHVAQTVALSPCFRFTVGQAFVRPGISVLASYEGIRRVYQGGTVNTLFTRFTGRQVRNLPFPLPRNKRV